jgi:hypothetical protein
MELIAVPRLGGDVALLEVAQIEKGRSWLVGRHCATGLHKLGARYAVPLKTNAGDNARMGWSRSRARVEYELSMAAICAHSHYRGT